MPTRAARRHDLQVAEHGRQRRRPARFQCQAIRSSANRTPASQASALPQRRGPTSGSEPGRPEHRQRSGSGTPRRRRRDVRGPEEDPRKRDGERARERGQNRPVVEPPRHRLRLAARARSRSPPAISCSGGPVEQSPSLAGPPRRSGSRGRSQAHAGGERDDQDVSARVGRRQPAAHARRARAEERALARATRQARRPRPSRSARPAGR